MITLNIIRKPANEPIKEPVNPVNETTENPVKEATNKTIDQTWSIEQIANEAPPHTWETIFSDAKLELKDISTILDEEEKTYGQYYPLKQDIFAAFNHTPLPNVKVVIIGQDPYHQTITINGKSTPRAIGRSFSVHPEDTIPSSLNNIYTELESTVRGFKRPDHGNLEEWEAQGVALLNSCLTVRPGHAGSHGDIWLGVMNKVFKAIAAVNPYCIYLLWGREAQKLRPMLGERSIVLEAAHPSGLSARRGFFGSNHFNQVNDILIRQGKIGINWRISTLAEFRRVNNIANGGNIGNGGNIALPLATNNHVPQLAPVNVAILPTILPLRQVEQRAQIISIPQVQVPLTALPIIPNTKPNTPGTLAKQAGNQSPTFSFPTIPLFLDGDKVAPGNNPVVAPANAPANAPAIPKIIFGTTVTRPTPAGLTGLPTLPSPLPSPLPPAGGVPQIIVRQQAVVAPQPLKGLPLIPTIV